MQCEAGLRSLWLYLWLLVAEHKELEWERDKERASQEVAARLVLDRAKLELADESERLLS